MKNIFSYKNFFWGFLILIILALVGNKFSLVHADEPTPLDKLIYLPIVLNGYPPSVEILGNYTYSVSPYDGAISGFGEIVNHTSHVIYPTIYINTYDSNGNFYKTFSFEFSTPLAPSSTANEKTCFNFYLLKELRADPDIASFKFKGTDYRVINSDYIDIKNQFNITDSIFYNDGVIQGHVINNSQSTSYNTYVIATYYNESGNVVNCTSDYINDFVTFIPGQVNSFSVEPYFPYGSEILSSYRLQVLAWLVR